MKYNLHTHQQSTNVSAIEIINQYPKEIDLSLQAISIGIHPWYIERENWQDELQIIDQHLHLPQVYALGECGIDRRISIPIELQKEVLQAQLHLAEKHQKPVILHCVSAYSEIISIKKTMKIKVPMIIHGFSKNLQTAQALLRQGFYLSFGKHLTNNPTLAQNFQKIPPDKIFLETDTMQITIDQVYQKAHTILGHSIEAQIEHNFQQVFPNKKKL